MVSQTYLGFSEEVLDKLNSPEASGTTLRSARITARITARILKVHHLETSTLALDMTNFATWADPNNDAASLPSQASRSPPKTARWRPAGS